MTGIDDSFKEQITIFYLSHMRRVAQDLFDQGYKTSVVASKLLITKEKAERLRELYDKGLLLNTDTEQSTHNLSLPFAKISAGYRWEDFAYETKCAAKVFFEMWLSVRAIASYLHVPKQTVYAWRKLYKQNKFRIDVPVEKLPPLNLTTEKLTVLNGRKCYSYEIRQAAKDCFQKGMNAYDVGKYLGIPKDTAYSWLRLFKEGRFYVNEEEKTLLGEATKKAPSVPTFALKQVAKGKRLIYTEEVRQAARACFDEGIGYRATADRLDVPQSTVREWNRLYKKGQFPMKQPAKAETKT